MFIKNRKITKKKTGKTYNYHAVLESTRVGGKPTTNTVVYLWSGFDVPSSQWPQLMFNVKAILNGQGSLWPLSSELDEVAQRIASMIREKRNRPPKPSGSPAARNTFKQVLPTPENPCDGVAQVALLAMEKLGFDKAVSFLARGHDKGVSLADNEKIRVAKCIVAAKMQKPTSERGTYDWLLKGGRSLGELVGLNFSLRSPIELYRLPVILFKHMSFIQNDEFLPQSPKLAINRKFRRIDLTNTYFEGNPKSNLAKRGRSKEKRSDRPLLSISIVSDEKSYVRSLRFYPGNVVESKTLIETVEGLKDTKDVILIMDRGIATAENIEWLHERGFKYIVGSRERRRDFDPAKVTGEFVTKSDHVIKLYLDDKPVPRNPHMADDVRIRCTSPAQRIKETSIISARCQSYQKGLLKLDQRCRNLVKPMMCAELMRRIGALDAKYNVKSHHKLTIETKPFKGDEGPIATGVKFEYIPVPSSKADQPGVYAIRTNVKDMSPEEILEAYFTLTQQEDIFKTLKSELALRPIHHHVESRILGHVVVDVMAYQCVNWIRNKLKANGVNDRWTTIRDCLMDVNCERALSKKADMEERRDLLPLEVEQAREYFKALGLTKPLKPIAELR